jgi:hypothetical protein
MRNVPETYSVRVHRTDGTCRLLLGQPGRLPRMGKIIKLLIGQGDQVVARIVAHPKSEGQPAEL